MAKRKLYDPNRNLYGRTQNVRGTHSRAMGRPTGCFRCRRTHGLVNKGFRTQPSAFEKDPKGATR
eukprot:11205021-Lingulodinium_polyedra.AAC.1